MIYNITDIIKSKILKLNVLVETCTNSHSYDFFFRNMRFVNCGKQMFFPYKFLKCFYFLFFIYSTKLLQLLRGKYLFNTQNLNILLLRSKSRKKLKSGDITIFKSPCMAYSMNAP